MCGAVVDWLKLMMHWAIFFLPLYGFCTTTNCSSILFIFLQFDCVSHCGYTHMRGNHNKPSARQTCMHCARLSHVMTSPIAVLHSFTVPHSSIAPFVFFFSSFFHSFATSLLRLWCWWYCIVTYPNMAWAINVLWKIYRCCVFSVAKWREWIVLVGWECLWCVCVGDTCNSNTVRSA